MCYTDLKKTAIAQKKLNNGYFVGNSPYIDIKICKQ